MRLNLAFKKIDLLTLSSRRPVSWFGQGEAVSPPPTPHLSLQVRLGCPISLSFSSGLSGTLNTLLTPVWPALGHVPHWTHSSLSCSSSRAPTS